LSPVSDIASNCLRTVQHNVWLIVHRNFIGVPLPQSQAYFSSLKETLNYLCCHGKCEGPNYFRCCGSIRLHALLSVMWIISMRFRPDCSHTHYFVPTKTPSSVPKSEQDRWYFQEVTYLFDRYPEGITMGYTFRFS
jgi:hypothetical protein